MEETRLAIKLFKWDWSDKGRLWSWSTWVLLKETNQEHIIDIDIPVTDFDTLLQKVEDELMTTEVNKWLVELNKHQKL